MAVNTGEMPFGFRLDTETPMGRNGEVSVCTRLKLSTLVSQSEVSAIKSKSIFVDLDLCSCAYKRVSGRLTARTEHTSLASSSIE